LLQALDRMIICMNNLAVKARRARRVSPENVLVLLPSCLQASNCKQNVIGDLAECKRCGRCKLGPLIDLCEKKCVRMAVAKGGRVAVALARRADVKWIIAVACEKELRSGIFACFPKPVLALTNTRPNGPCCETAIDVDEVERAIARLTGL